MENTQIIWILYVIMLSLNCLISEEGATTAKRHLIINAAGLIQHRYFENVLTSKFTSKGMFLWRRSFAFVSTGNEKLWIHSGLRKIRFDQERDPEKSPVGADDPDVWVLHSEHPQDYCLRWWSLTKYSSQDLTIILNFL